MGKGMLAGQTLTKVFYTRFAPFLDGVTQPAQETPRFSMVHHGVNLRLPPDQHLTGAASSAHHLQVHPFFHKLFVQPMNHQPKLLIINGAIGKQATHFQAFQGCRGMLDQQFFKLSFFNHHQNTTLSRAAKST